MIDASAIASAAGVPCMISGEMQQRMQLWEDMYINAAVWQNKRIKSMHLPATVARELKRLVLTEFAASVDDAQLDASLQIAVQKLRRALDFGLASGGMLLKPYYYGGATYLDIVPQTAYVPINYNDSGCTAVICPEEIAVGKTYYTRLEQHYYDSASKSHTIRQQCYKSGMPGVIGTECSLAEVEQWADVVPEKVYTGADKPLFSIFQNPDANNIDTTSPLGISVYADAADFIKDADIQWERILWELESSERAVNASADLFRFVGGKPVLPKGRERMYQLVQIADTKPFIETFSPEIRDASYFNSLNQILRRIENTCGLSYGTLSDVADVDKTAEEIKSSKQRSYTRVADIQCNLKYALDGALYGMQYYRDYYANRKSEPLQLACTFGDGILEDTEKEYQRRLQMVREKLLKPEKFMAWYFGCSEQDAAEMIPDAQSDGGLFSGGDA